MSFTPQEWVPLGPLTTFELGGPSRYFAEIASEDELVQGLTFAEEKDLPVLILGGGSNLLVSDQGFAGLTLRLALRGCKPLGDGRFTLGAGEIFDDVVAQFSAAGWAGLECLSGIPGTVGAGPVQNIGAYGQELGDLLTEIRVWDRKAKAILNLARSSCQFAYRDSLFKRDPNRFIILAVTLALAKSAPQSPRSEEVMRALSAHPSVEEVRQVVLGIRRSKGMVYDRQDPLRRTAGSFFTHPLVAAKDADAIAEKAHALAGIPSPSPMPRYPASEGRVKIPAAWLIEQAGFSKGFRQGSVGISPFHALCLVHYGGGTTAQLLDLARLIRDRVHQSFGVLLWPEPVFVGMEGFK